MIEFWQNVSQPQATIISGLLTLGSAILVVYLGARLFGDKVTDLRGAFDNAQRDLRAHVDAMDASLRELSAKSERLDDLMDKLELQIGDMTTKLQQIEIKLVDAEDQRDAWHAPETLRPEIAAERSFQDDADKNREAFRNAWREFRDRIEAIASNPAIDGRTRARYFRIDRRDYGELIDALIGDDLLPDPDAARRAVELWHTFRNGKRTPSDNEIAELHAARNGLLIPTESNLSGEAFRP